MSVIESFTAEERSIIMGMKFTDDGKLLLDGLKKSRQTCLENAELNHSHDNSAKAIVNLTRAKVYREIIELMDA